MRCGESRRSRRGRARSEDRCDALPVARLRRLPGSSLRRARGLVCLVRPQALDDAGHERHVRPRENRDADRVGVFLDRGLDDLLRSLMETGVDHLHAGVTQGPAMILAPRSCPSSPGLAITTRIFRSTWAVYGREIHRHRVLTRVAEPRWRTFRLSPRALRVGCSSTVVRVSCRGWRARGVAPRRRDRDHPFPSRPLGGPRPVGLGSDVSGRRYRDPQSAGALGARGRPWSARAVRGAIRVQDMFDQVFTVLEYEPRARVHGSRYRRDSSATAALHAGDVWVPVGR